MCYLKTNIIKRSTASIMMICILLCTYLAASASEYKTFTAYPNNEFYSEKGYFCDRFEVFDDYKYVIVSVDNTSSASCTVSITKQNDLLEPGTSKIVSETINENSSGLLFNDEAFIPGTYYFEIHSNEKDAAVSGNIIVLLAKDKETLDQTLAEISAKNKSLNDVNTAGVTPMDKAIVSLSEKNIITGYDDGFFYPEKNISRAEMAAVIYRTKYGQNTPENTSVAFEDMKGHWAEGYVAQAVSDGIVNGIDDKHFLPDSNVTNEKVLKMLVCMKGLTSEAEERGGYPKGHILTAVYHGFMDNIEAVQSANAESSYQTEAATRGNAALMLYNALK